VRNMRELGSYYNLYSTTYLLASWISIFQVSFIANTPNKLANNNEITDENWQIAMKCQIKIMMSNFYQKLPTMLAMKFVLSIIPDVIIKEIKIKIKNYQQFYQKYDMWLYSNINIDGNILSSFFIENFILNFKSVITNNNPSISSSTFFIVETTIPLHFYHKSNYHPQKSNHLNPQ